MHAVARRVGELALHDLERGTVPSIRAWSGNRANASRSGGGPGVGQCHEGLRERATGRDRGDEVAQSVGPRGLQLAEPRGAPAAEVRPREQRRPRPPGRARPARCRSRRRSRRTRPPRPPASRRRTGAGSAGRPACASQSCADRRRRRGTRPAAEGHRLADDEPGERARRTPRSRARRASVMRPAPRRQDVVQRPAHPARGRAGSPATPGARPSIAAGSPIDVADEERLDGEVVAERGDDGGDLHHLTADARRRRC